MSANDSPGVARDVAVDDRALSILIVSYNTREMTIACLRSLFTSPPAASFEVIVVDNASGDGSAAAIASHFPQVRLIARTDNVGFAAANNEAARLAGGTYLLLLNPDTLVLPGAIDRLLAFARHRPAAGIWGGRTRFADGRLNPASCWRRMTTWGLLCTATGLAALFRGSRVFNPEAYGGWQRDSERGVDIVSGCFLLISRTLWEQLGGFDRAFFMYGEDADLCLRARRLGARPRITPDAEIVHYGGASEPSRADKLVRLLTAKVGLVQRHGPWGLRRLKIALLAAWPCLRRLAALVPVPQGRQRRRERAAQWSEVWNRRREWLAGIGQPPALSGAALASAARRRRVLAVASGGGHFIQLLRMRPAWAPHDVAYVTTEPGYREMVAPARFYAVADASRWNKLGLVRVALQLLGVILRERPDVVISTGAAPGYLAVRIGRWLGARAIWVDSIANVDELSLSGRRAGRHAQLWLTQWSHLARPQGPRYVGAVL